MKKLILIPAIFLFAMAGYSQYTEISVEKADVPSLKIVQIDYCEYSTLVHFQYKNVNASGWACVNDGFHIMDTINDVKYKMVNSINMPICDKVHVFDEVDQIHNFTLEFEKLPDSLFVFDVIETVEGGFNFYGVQVDTSIRATNFLDIDKFIAKTPVKEYGVFYSDGNPVIYYKHKGIMIAAMVTYNQSYGKYYAAALHIQNLTGKDLNFNPDAITATLQVKNDTLTADVLSYGEYMKKVTNRQAWNAALVAFGESMAAENAGYSSSTTRSSAYGTSHSSGYASGYVGNTYGSVYGSSSTYSSAYGSSTTNSYNGAAAYAARQNANQNIANYQQQQYSIKNTVSEGYLRLNTIPNESEYIGYINIKYKKADNLLIRIPFNGEVYNFYW